MMSHELGERGLQADEHGGENCACEHGDEDCVYERIAADEATTDARTTTIRKHVTASETTEPPSQHTTTNEVRGFDESEIMASNTLKLAVAITLSFLGTLVLTYALVMVSSMFLKYLGYRELRLWNPLVLPFIASIIIGTIVGYWQSKRIIVPIVEISNATKRIARGEFNVVLRRQSRVREVQTMAENFSLMASELSRTEMLRNDFISNVSHEFKTPLSAIEGYATLLNNPQLSEEKRAAYTEKILANSRRLSSLTDSILKLSKLENTQVELEKRWFSLDEQLRESILSFEDTWETRHITLDVNLEDVSISGDKDLLAQVWQNLLANAAKFTPEGGTVRVSTHDDGLVVHVCVADTGCGMSEEAIQRAFEKFYQAETSHVREGNGLGLAIAKRIVDLHSGSITVNSEIGKGSSFTVTLPRHGRS